MAFAVSFASEIGIPIRLGMQISLAKESAQAMRRVRRVEQLA
ncbi:MAG: hypothetical protein QOD69_2264 [Solirubrobacteraceae bacterium]|nr:hypothetical protein [Solirubrobacteraceae bacterium]